MALCEVVHAPHPDRSIPALVRRGIEAALAKGDVHFLVRTGTLLQNVKFSAVNLFICKSDNSAQKNLKPW